MYLFLNFLLRLCLFAMDAIQVCRLYRFPKFLLHLWMLSIFECTISNSGLPCKSTSKHSKCCYLDIHIDLCMLVVAVQFVRWKD